MDGTVRQRAPWLAVVALGLALGACMPKRSGLEPLQEAVMTYNEGLRWERFTAAAAHVPSAERGAFLEERDGLSKYLRITGYDVVGVDVTNEARTAARVVVKYEWYDDRKGTVEETQVRQIWARRKSGWLLMDEASIRGAEMPGVSVAPADEPTDDAADAADAGAGPVATDGQANPPLGRQDQGATAPQAPPEPSAHAP